MKYLLILVAIAMLVSANAYAACPEDAPMIGPEPIIVNTNCPFVCWDAATGTIRHYHVFLDGEYWTQTLNAEPGVEVCLPNKSLDYSIQVYSINSTDPSASPVSDATVIVWLDPPTPTPITPPPATPTPATPTPPVICYETQEVEVPCP